MCGAGFGFRGTAFISVVESPSSSDMSSVSFAASCGGGGVSTCALTSSSSSTAFWSTFVLKPPCEAKATGRLIPVGRFAPGGFFAGPTLGRARAPDAPEDLALA